MEHEQYVKEARDHWNSMQPNNIDYCMSCWLIKYPDLNPELVVDGFFKEERVRKVFEMSDSQRVWYG